MKLSHKLAMVSVATLMGISPVVGAAVNNANTVQAATVYKTYGKNSKITATKTMYFVDANGKKTNKKAYEGGKYVIWLVKKINGKTYYGIQTDGKYWIPASATKGKVSYSTKTTKKSTKVAKKSTKKATKKTTSSKKSTTTKTTKKTTSSNKKAANPKPVKIVTTRASQVYDQNGKAVKTYMGNKKYTVIGKNVKLDGLGTKTIKGIKYVALQPNKYYIKASNVKER